MAVGYLISRPSWCQWFVSTHYLPTHMRMVGKIKKNSHNINKSTSCNNCPPYSTISSIANSYQHVLLALLSSIKTSIAIWNWNRHLITFQMKVFSKKLGSNSFIVLLVESFISFISYCSPYQQCKIHYLLTIRHYTSCITHSFVLLFSGSSTILDGSWVNVQYMLQVSVTREMIVSKESKPVTLTLCKLPFI